MEIFSVYILYSESLDSYYIGSTKDIDRRLREHNRGKSTYTKRGMPWNLVYNENYETKSEAYKRELELKSWKSKVKIKELISLVV